MDKKDRLILTLLQTDARLSNNEIAEQVNLSPTACWKRIQRILIKADHQHARIV